MPPLHAYILAGGRSSRFGSDKARALRDGEPLIVGVARSLGPFARSVTVVAREVDRYADFGLRTIADDEPGLGPLGGLATACRDTAASSIDQPQSQQPWILLASCDLLVIRPRWVQMLLDALPAPLRLCEPDRVDRVEPDAVAFRHRLWEPLLALYSPRLGPLCAARLAAGKRSMQGLLDTCRARDLPLPADWPAVVQANRPEDLRRTPAGTGDAPCTDPL